MCQASPLRLTLLQTVWNGNPRPVWNESKIQTIIERSLIVHILFDLMEEIILEKYPKVCRLVSSLVLSNATGCDASRTILGTLRMNGLLKSRICRQAHHCHFRSKCNHDF